MKRIMGRRRSERYRNGKKNCQIPSGDTLIIPLTSFSASSLHLSLSLSLTLILSFIISSSSLSSNFDAIVYHAIIISRNNFDRIIYDNSPSPNLILYFVTSGNNNNFNTSTSNISSLSSSTLTAQFIKSSSYQYLSK